jgi:hypothetical protein
MSVERCKLEFPGLHNPVQLPIFREECRHGQVDGHGVLLGVFVGQDKFCDAALFLRDYCANVRESTTFPFCRALV